MVDQPVTNSSKEKLNVTQDHAKSSAANQGEQAEVKEGTTLSNEKQEYKWMNKNTDALDEEEIYAHLRYELKQLKQTCDQVKARGLGGEPVNEAIVLLEKLLIKVDREVEEKNAENLQEGDIAKEQGAL